MSVLYNSFRLATDSRCKCDARAMFRNQIDDTLYELEETLCLALDSNHVLVDYQSYRTSKEEFNLPNGMLYSFNLYPRADSELFKNLSATFNNEGDGEKIMQVLYKTLECNSPSLAIFAPDKKGRITVYYPSIPVTDEAEALLGEPVDYIRMNDSLKIAEVIKTWLEKNFDNESMKAIYDVFQDTIQDDQSTLQFSRRSDDYNRVMNITRTAVAKLKR